LRVIRDPEEESLNMTREPLATTVPDIASRPPLADPATSRVIQVVLYVPSPLISHTMSP